MKTSIVGSLMALKHEDPSGIHLQYHSCLDLLYGDFLHNSMPWVLLLYSSQDYSTI